MTSFIDSTAPWVDALLCFALWLSALLQIAILRDRSLREQSGTHSSRWLVAAGFTLLAARFTVLLFADGDVPIPTSAAAPLALLALGNIGMCLDRLRRPYGSRRATDAYGPEQWRGMMR